MPAGRIEQVTAEGVELLLPLNIGIILLTLGYPDPVNGERVFLDIHTGNVRLGTGLDAVLPILGVMGEEANINFGIPVGE